MWRMMLVVAWCSVVVQPALSQLVQVGTQGFSGALWDCYPADITPGYTDSTGPSCVRAADAVYAITQGANDTEDTLYRITPAGVTPVLNPLTGAPMTGVRSLRVGHDASGVTNKVVGRSEVADGFNGITDYVIWSMVGGIVTIEASLRSQSGIYPQHSVWYGPVVGTDRVWWVHGYKEAYGNHIVNLRSSAGDSTEAVPFDGCPSTWTCRLFDVAVTSDNTMLVDIEGPDPRLAILDMGTGVLTRGPSFPYNHVQFQSHVVLEGKLYAWTGNMQDFEGFYRITGSSMTPVPWAAGMNPSRTSMVVANGTLYISDQLGTPSRAIWRLEPASDTWIRVVDAPWSFAYASALGDRMVFFDVSTSVMGVVDRNGTVTLLDVPFQDYMFAEVRPDKTFELDGWLYFVGNDKRQSALWRTNGEVVELVGEPSPDIPVNASRKTVKSLLGIVDGKVLTWVQNSLGAYPYTTEIWAYTPEPAGSGGGGGGGSDPVHTTLTHMGAGAGQNVWAIDSSMPADSGFVFGPNMYADVAKAQAFAMPDGLSGALESVDITWGYKAPSVPAGATYSVQVYDGSPESGPAGSPLREMTFPMASVSADDDATTDESPVTYTFDPPVAVGPSFFVSVDFGSYSASMNGAVTLASGGFEGHRVPEVWELWSSGAWANVSDAWLGGNDGWILWMSATVVTGQGVDAEALAEMPSAVRLDAAYPNPFNPQTTVTWALDAPAHARLAVYDALGREVQVLVDGEHPAGEYHALFNAKGLASGLYLVRLQTPGRVLTRQIILMK